MIKERCLFRDGEGRTFQTDWIGQTLQNGRTGCDFMFLWEMECFSGDTKLKIQTENEAVARKCFTLLQKHLI